MDELGDNLICHVCHKTFSSVSSKNKHLRSIHQEDVKRKPRSTVSILCPVCTKENKESFGSHDLLINHLENIHSLTIKTSFHNFKTMEEFETWRAHISRSVDYVVHSTNIERSSNIKRIYYNCNRSDYKGFKSKCSQRSMKAGGSIRISGWCPSRIYVKICNSEITVKYIETHVGHDDELRAKHLTHVQQQMIANKLIAGVTKERVLQDARVMRDQEVERINILNRGDLAYIMRKFNIDKRRHDNDMIATAMKVEEWNNQEENSVFLFKQIGEEYPGLKKEDFVLGFMNRTMERKLKEFKKIICIDGTHGTNARNWDLTIILVKDENNIGFPVAFLISNRLDQTVQKIFFSSLKSKIGEAINAEYIMSDDDIKYYNAWCQVMVEDRKPRRLLCTWHVIKNWNIQGRNKLKKPEMKEQMKNRMRCILKETNLTKFLELKENYFSELIQEGEIEFLNYLRNHYFQSEDRVKTWAYCHRINVGINTNMAIESLNKVLKYNKMRGNKNIRIEQLLDLLEELVTDKMWKKIIDTERPTANIYQARINREAHLKAENEVSIKVTFLHAGEFKVPSSSTPEKFYIVSYNELCDDDCRRSYCDKCKICIHRFQCQCPEYTVKTALCKHIHAVALFEKRSDYVVGTETVDDEERNLFVAEPSTSRSHYETDVKNFIEENKASTSNVADPCRQKEITIERACMLLRLLNDDTLYKVTNFIEKSYSEQINACNSMKRKMDKQLYYPSKK